MRKKLRHLLSFVKKFEDKAQFTILSQHTLMIHKSTFEKLRNHLWKTGIIQFLQAKKIRIPSDYIRASVNFNDITPFIISQSMKTRIKYSRKSHTKFKKRYVIRKFYYCYLSKTEKIIVSATIFQDKL